MIMVFIRLNMKFDNYGNYQCLFIMIVFVYRTIYSKIYRKKSLDKILMEGFKYGIEFKINKKYILE